MGQGFPSQRLGVNISAGTGLALTGTVVFSNSNAVTFGAQLSASSFVVTASVLGGANISAGTTQITSGTAVFSNSGGISFGINAQTVTAQYGISAGTTQATAGNSGVVFSNSNGISFGASGGTITASASSVSLSLYKNPFGMALLGSNVMQPSSSTQNISLQRFSMPFALTVTQVDLVRHLTVVGSTAGSYTIGIGIYTMAGSTASLVSSDQVAVTWNSGTSTSAASNNYGGQSGTRWRFIILSQSWNMTPGEYLFGCSGTFAGVAGTTGSITIFGQSALSINAQVSNTGNYSKYWNMGLFSTGTAGFPASIHLSALIQTGSLALAQPYFQLIGSGP